MPLPAEPSCLWMATAPGQPFARLEREVAVDVAVIGAGVTGLTTASLLKSRGRSVAVLEGGRVAAGASGQTTAHLTEALDQRYVALIDRFGEDTARRLAQASGVAIERIQALAEGTDCGLRCVPGFLYTHGLEEAEKLREEAEAAARLGVRASFTRDVPLPFPARGAVRFEDQARLHPRRYLLALAASLPGDGSYVFEESRVREVAGGDPYVLVTDRGLVRAHAVVMATHVPLSRVVLSTHLSPSQTYVLALRLAGPMEDALFWDTEDPYHYVRLHHEAGEPILIVGGADHHTGHEADTLVPYQALWEWVRGRFEVGEILHRWSGQIEEPVDGLPYIGRVPGTRTYVASGYLGTGLTFGTLAGLVLSDLVAGGSSPWEDTFRLTRLSALASAREFLQHNLDVAYRFVADRLFGGEPGAPADVPPGEARVVSAGGRKLAVHRAVNGVLTARSAVCPHLGCIVQWNRAEESWDCPCHGSRFAASGEVLNGPAAQGLDPVLVEDEAAAVGD